MTAVVVTIGSIVRRPIETVDPRQTPDEEFVYIDIGSVDNRSKSIEAPVTLFGREAPTRARQVVRRGDVLVATTRPYLNAVAVVPNALDGAVCSTGFTVLRPTPVLDSQYLFMWVRNPDFIDGLSRLIQGALYPAVTDRQVLSRPIALPSVPEQRRVAARLTARLAATDHLRQRAVKGRHDIAALRIGLLRAELGLPASGESSVGEPAWPVTLLGDVAHIQLGKMLSPKSKIGTRPVPYLRNANVQWDRLDLSEVYTMDFTETEEAKFTLVRGDLLVCEGGEPGRAAIWNGELNRCCYQKALHRIRPKGDKLDPEFLLHRLRLGGLTNEFVGTHAKTTIAHLPAIRLANLHLALPPVEDQRRIAARLTMQLADLAEAERAAQAEIAVIHALPNSLLREAFVDA